MKLRLLRYLFLIDAALLSVIGALLICAPRQIETAFGFRDLPRPVDYIIALWGCGLGTLAIGYFVAAANPIRHRVWAQVGIARGVLESLVGLIYLSQGIINLQQGGLGIIIAGIMSIAYVVLYPRIPRIAATTAGEGDVQHPVKA